MAMTFDFSELISGLDNYKEKAEAAISKYADTSALKLQNYARKNAPWTDRTAHARQRLTGDSIVVSNGYKLRLAHGVYYGIYLELCNEKRYAILEPTINKVGTSQIIPGFERLLERL